MHRHRSPFLPLFFAIGLSLAGQTFAQGSDLPLASNLQTEAAQARQRGTPLVIIFSRADCRYCEAVKRDYLKPLAASPRYRERLVVRQVNQDSEAPLINFRGETSTHARFSASEKIKLVPVVAFYGSNGQQLAEPIIGARLPDFYQSYLEEAIEKASVSLKTH